MAKVPVHDDEGHVIARVEYNNNLDFWNGSNWTCGSTGRHLGLTRLKKSGQYVLINGTQWQGERDSATIITPEEAYQHIVDSGNEDLLDKFPELNEFGESLDQEEGEEDIPTTIQVTKGFKDQLEELKLNPGETYQEMLTRMIPELQEVEDK